MKTKHTQGEWINLGYRVDVDVADGLSGICVMSEWMPKEEMEANAKLIAAAPELLAALLSITEYWITPQKDSLTQHIEHSLKLAEKAIKKATE